MGWAVVRAVRRFAIYIAYPGDMHLQTSFLAELPISGAKQQPRLIARDTCKVFYAVRIFMQLQLRNSALTVRGYTTAGATSKDGNL